MYYYDNDLHKLLKNKAKEHIRNNEFTQFIDLLNNSTYKKSIEQVNWLTPLAPFGSNWAYELGIPDDVPVTSLIEIDTPYLYEQKDLKDFLNEALLHNKKEFITWLLNLTNSHDNLNVFILNPFLFSFDYFERYAEQNGVEIQNFEPVFEQLIALKKKVIDLEQRGYHDDALDAYQLARNLQKEMLNLVDSKSPSATKTFKDNCSSLIDFAKNRALSTHRGCKEILLNLAMAIIGVGVVYLLAASVNYYLTDGKHFFFKFDTASDQIVDELAVRINNV
ncbi:MAG: hypothetical protein EPN84_00195 [Legionella sp.]|nr:MAG: hypothetical protein EPN84_00195 [Legionella sp.]